MVVVRPDKMSVAPQETVSPLSGYHGQHRCRPVDRMFDVGSRLGPVTRQFDLPAPEPSLRVQDCGRQCGNEVDGRGTRPRPGPVVRSCWVNDASRLVPALQPRSADSRCLPISRPPPAMQRTLIESRSRTGEANRRRICSMTGGPTMAAISEPSPNRQAREVLGTANIAGSGSGVGGGWCQRAAGPVVTSR